MSLRPIDKERGAAAFDSVPDKPARKGGARMWNLGTKEGSYRDPTAAGD